MNKLVIAVVVLIGIVAGIVLLSGNKKTTDVVSRQPATTNEEEQQSQQAPTFSEPSNTIVLTQEGFDPQILTVEVGTKVSWVNKSGGKATVNSAPHPIHSNYQPLNLNSFEEGEFLELVFDKAGTYNYHDHLNPARTGTVIVK